jgi:EmrB/QacA subfamily drug resistance transporter
MLEGPMTDQGAVAGAAAVAPEAERPVMIATIAASAMAFIDATVIHVALPILRADLGATLGQLQWIVNGYALFLGALILVGGAAGDRYGRRLVFLIGTAAFGAASAFCALAATAEALILARMLQGVGAALLVPQSLAIIAASFPPERRGAAIGVWAAAAALTTALGPALGGVLMDLFGWRSAFWINIPLTVAVLWVTVRSVPESRNPQATGALDWAGGALACGGFGALTWGVSLIAEGGWRVVLSLPFLGIGWAMLRAFVRHEARAPAPLMPLALFRSRVFLGANLMTLLLYGALTAAMFLIPFEVIGRRGNSATLLGLVFAPLGVIIALVSHAVGRLADRTGPRPLLVAGSALVSAALFMLAGPGPSFFWNVLWPVCLLGLGMAFVVTPLTTAVMNAAPDALSGAASGVNNAASRIAGLIAVAVASAVAALSFAARHEGEGRFGAFPDPADPHAAEVAAAFLGAYGDAMTMAALWAAGAAVVSAAMLGPERAPDPGPDPQ